MQIDRASRGGPSNRHVFDTVDLLFDWRRYGFRYYFRIRARIIGSYLNRGRSYLGILSNGKGRKGDEADQCNDDADYARKNRSIDEKMRKVHGQVCVVQIHSLLRWLFRFCSRTANLFPAATLFFC